MPFPLAAATIDEAGVLEEEGVVTVAERAEEGEEETGEEEARREGEDSEEETAAGVAFFVPSDSFAVCARLSSVSADGPWARAALN